MNSSRFNAVAEKLGLRTAVTLPTVSEAERKSDSVNDFAATLRAIEADFGLPSEIEIAPTDGDTDESSS